MSEKLLLNRIRTPDGTVMTSYNRHDYRTYKDTSNGLTYMVDGGTDYLRRTIHEGVDDQYEELSVWMTDNHEANRQAFHWGTYGKHGDQPKTFRPLCELSTDHIIAIVETQKQISGAVRDLMDAEIKYRIDNS